MALGARRQPQSSKQKKLKKRSKFLSDLPNDNSPFTQPRPTPKPLKRQDKRPTKREKRREQRDAQDFPGMRQKVNGETLALVPGEGILRFVKNNGINDDDGESNSDEEPDNISDGSIVDVEKEEIANISADADQEEQADKQEDTGFISLDFDDESTELGQRFAQYEESNIRYVNEYACPWMEPTESRETKPSVNEQMSAEVLDFLQYMSPTKAEMKKREDCVNRLRRIVKQLWPDATVSVFGSFATGMYLPDADIDVVIMSDTMRAKIRGEMFRLSARLKSNRLAESVSVISHARVPIVKYVESGSGINVDIAFSQSGGIETVGRVSSWLDSNKALKPLAMVIRQFLKRRKLSDVANGGLGGYATICLVYSRMQQRLSDISIEDVLHNIGVLLLDFFEYYGHQFDNVGQYIRPLQAPQCHPLSKRINGSMATPQASGLAIEDPNDKSNNISKASYNYLTVKRSFANAADYLKGLCMEWQKLPKSQKCQISFLGPLLKFTGQEPKRSKVALDRALSIIRLQPQTKPQPSQPGKNQKQKSASASAPTSSTVSPAHTPAQPQRTDTRKSNKPTAQASRIEKGRGVDSYDPWVDQQESSSDSDLIGSPEVTKTNDLGASKTQRPAENGKRKGQEKPTTSPTTKRRVNNSNGPPKNDNVGNEEKEDDDEEDEDDSRTKLTTAQRRQFWSRKAGNLETAQASS